jgi:UDP-MurNAc hydroxylase
MKLTNIGGATAVLEHNGKRMLFDPWMNDGIFHGAWYHFPPLNVDVEDLGRLDYVYISHIHEDHCSAGTIRRINPDAEIILMDREPNYVAKFLQGHGFRFRKIHLVKPRTPLKLAGDLIVDIVEPDPADEMARLIDSALVINWDSFVVYNANDCQPHRDGIDYIRRHYGKVDLALLPYTGGSGYPACYVNLSSEEKAAEKSRILALRLDAFVDTVRQLEPVYAMPFADQYVVAGSRSHLNRFISHPPGPGVVRDVFAHAALEAHLLLLNSGQTFDFSSPGKVLGEPYRDVAEDDREHYIVNSLQQVRYDHEKLSFSPGVPLERLVHHARARLWQEQERQECFPRFSFYLDAADGKRRFHLPLDSPETATIPFDAPCVEPFLRITAPRDLLIMLLIGHVSWNIADAALFLDYERVPNRYDPALYALLNYLRI